MESPMANQFCLRAIARQRAEEAGLDYNTVDVAMCGDGWKDFFVNNFSTIFEFGVADKQVKRKTK